MPNLGKHLWQSFFNKVVGWRYANLLKKTPAQVFSLYLCETFKNTEQLRWLLLKGYHNYSFYKMLAVTNSWFLYETQQWLKWFTVLQDNYVKILNVFFFRGTIWFVQDLPLRNFWEKKQQDFLKFGFLLWRVMMNSWVFKIPTQIKRSKDVIMLTIRHLPAQSLPASIYLLDTNGVVLLSLLLTFNIFHTLF